MFGPRLYLQAALVLCAVALGLVSSELGLRLYRQWQASSYQPYQPLEQGYVADPLVGYRPERFRGPTLPPPESLARRIVVLGGSTVLGVNVGDEETIPVLLGRELQRHGIENVAVLNAGASGYTSWREYLLYEAYVRDLKPEIVVQLNGLNDLYYSAAPEWPAMLREAQLLAARQKRPAELVGAIDSTAFAGLALSYHAENALRLAIRWSRLTAPSLAEMVWGAPGPTENTRGLAVYRAAERLLGRAVRADGSRLILATQPLLEYGDKPWTAQESSARERTPERWGQLVDDLYPRLIAAAATAAEEEEFDFFDLSRAFDGTTETTYASDALHYTRLGNELIAAALAERLAVVLQQGRSTIAQPAEPGR